MHFINMEYAFTTNIDKKKVGKNSDINTQII